MKKTINKQKGSKQRKILRLHLYARHQDSQERKCCDPPLSVLVMLVSRNVFHIVSALQSIVFILFFPADQVSCRSYVGSAYRMRSLAVSHPFKKSVLAPSVLGPNLQLPAHKLISPNSSVL